MTKLFRELAEGPGPSRHAAGRPGSAAAWVAGASALDAYAELLGLARGMARDVRRLRLEGASLEEGSGALSLTLAGGPLPDRMVVWVFPRAPTGPDDADLAVGLAGTPDSRTARRLLHAVQRRLSPAGYEALAGIMARDPSRRRVHASPRGAVERELADSVVMTHAAGDAWRCFFATREQRRNFNYRLAGHVVTVAHEDLECQYATVQPDALSFFRYSSRDEVEPRPPATRARGPAAGRRDVPEGWGSRLSTDLDDRAVIEGGAGVLERALEQVGRRVPRPELVLVHTTCVPKVTGDPVEETMARFEARSGLPTTCLDTLASSKSTVLGSVLARIGPVPVGGAPASRRLRVNLVGFARTSEVDALVQLLEALGAVVNARIIPEVDVRDVSRLQQAELQILYDSALYADAFEQILGHVDVRTLRPPPPYGMEGTRRWLAAVAGALGLEDRAEAVWGRTWERLAEPWEALRRRTAGLRFGVIADRHQLQLLREPRLVHGVPILAVLDELGIELELLAFAGDRPETSDLRGARVHAFATPLELEELLRSSPAAVFYSEYTYDRRLTRCGKAIFSVADFAIGPQGALATARRLLALARLPFYRRHAAHLGSAFSPGGAP